MAHSSSNPDFSSAPEVESNSNTNVKPLPKPEISLQELAGRNWATPRQVAKITGKAYWTVLRWIRPSKDPVTGAEIKPILKAVFIGGQYRIYEEELRRFLEEGNAKD